MLECSSTKFVVDFKLGFLLPLIFTFLILFLFIFATVGFPNLVGRTPGRSRLLGKLLEAVSDAVVGSS